MTYAKSGVDLSRVRRAHRDIAEMLAQTFRFRPSGLGRVLTGIGHYAGLIDVGGGRALALHADGVGTKVLVAQLMDRYDTVGVDCVAMNVNDLVCVGAEPLALVDYLVVERPDEEMISEIMRGLVRGAEMANVAVVGGETAVMPDVVRGEVEGRGFDLAALSVGVVDQGSILTGSSLRPGDVVVGVESSGIHSNGLTLARKVLLRGRSVHDTLPELDTSIGEELLRPTHIYVKPVLEAIRRLEVHAVAHITGGAFTKLRRFEAYAKVGFELDSMPEPHPIFKAIMRLGKVPMDEMYRTFNMGVGLCVMLPREHQDDVIDVFERHGFKAWRVGRVVDRPGVRVKPPGGEWIELG
ncbi:phosphoribosylformylglycinamidine cyclo-ligase [Candidatus Geothermarchaeota archaeon ex4572_27]|nr:MAG: phosphoribosylformylglycinamidine cyclo-ligase [Candidatus Geothermarchaeota archaeon ex4572_27]